MVTRSFEVLGIIPARGGSKGIPRKNILSFGGHPLLAWSIAAGQGSRLVQRVLVSTDDEEIAGIARAYGAETPFLRPSEIARDDTRDLLVFEHALEWLASNQGYRPDMVVQLRPTSPLRPLGLVDEAINLLISDERADSVRSVTAPSQSPFKMWAVNDGALTPLVNSDIHEPYNTPRQRLPQTLWQTGHIDAIWTYTIQHMKSMSGTRILPITVDPQYATDIDERVHWRLAEEILASAAREIVRPATTAALSLRDIRLIAFDFDGVFTDNRVYVHQDGSESVGCNRADGLGIERLLESGIDAAVLSTEANPVVAARCLKLRLPVRQGLANKGQALRELARERNLTMDQVAYVGNDLNDAECLAMAHIAFAPADANPAIRAVADIVLRNTGGNGAVREVCEMTISAQSHSKEVSLMSA